jgi:putative flippase GtrA
LKEIFHQTKRYKEILWYLFFGVLTTAVNWIVFQFCEEVLAINWSIANVIAWVAAVVFAYGTNRTVVFRSKSPKILREFLVFTQFRVLSLLMEMAIMFLLIELLGMEPFPSKVVTSVVVVVSNYFFSKTVIFKERS